MGPLQKIAALTPWFDEGSTKDYYTKIERTYLEWLSGTVVLDVGCGPGKLSQEFPAQYGVAAYVGLDVSPGMVRDARADNPDRPFYAVAPPACRSGTRAST